MSPSADPNARTPPTTTKSMEPHGELDSSKLIYSLTISPRAVPDAASATSGKETICTDHMITAVWKAGSGWEAPQLRPYGALNIMPTASVLNYATECFEGMKAYRGDDGKLRLFRPDRNCARFNKSASRISLPNIEANEMKKLIMVLLSVDGPRWLPKERAGSFLYLRPVMIGTDPQVGVKVPKEALVYIIACYLPPMDSYPGGMRLQTSPDDVVRAWVGGFGWAKLGANYGPSIMTKAQAAAQGFHETLWLYGDQGECTEAGASNFFVVWKRRDGKTELVTAPLDDKLILDGVTRGSCLELARQHLAGHVEVTERKFTIHELIEAHAEGRIREIFACGTGFFICPISHIHHQGTDITLPMDNKNQAGEVTSKLKTLLGDILYGRTEHSWAVVVPERE
ncbi:hypothetical protein LMH87_006722 [Akanthomyces muscarius]|uniref:Branched-chain-amino-acid aminotransferase n=1 Tax=Akanthomyces muscarius TaxID=2231603 RepID=A0A9W8QPE0_AKAMU|nr:hypothetical protein LMH87_006722 [Akanthomyces muscarius]KAJ4165075.1 hypothetical protein LMH87_006722 [Akanthomyces muscarius]